MYKSVLTLVFWVICTASLIGCDDSSSSPDLLDKASSSSNSDSLIVESSAQVLESSSSISGESSSSSRVSESSSSIESPKIMSLYDSISHTLTDLRDNQAYQTVAIGGKVWMAENLNYKYKADSKSFCYNDSTKYCSLYGRLYLNEAKDIVCPDKWHLPDSLEWEMLILAADKRNGPLKADSSWKDETQYGHPESKGTNETGFSALGGGYRANSSRYTSMGYTAAFWVAKAKRSFKIELYNTDSPYFEGLSTIGTPQAYSVRCLKDSE